MPRSAAPAWRTRKEPILDHLIHASVNQAGGKPDEKGGFAEIHYTGCATRERAMEIRRAAFRSKRHTGYSVSAKPKQDKSGEWRVIIRAHDPAMAKAYMIERYGEDRTKWPYSPKRGDPNFEGTGQ